MRTDPRHLLGGYATGNLSREEQRALFAAALEDPDLFAALADEVALKDLLSDPEAAARIRVALAPRARPLWRRPVLLGSAAGLLFVASTTALLWRDRPGPAPTPPLKTRPAPESAPSARTAAPASPVAPAAPPMRTETRGTPPPPPTPGALSAQEMPSARLPEAPPENRLKALADLPAEAAMASKSAPGPAAGSVERFAKAEARADGVALLGSPLPRLVLFPEGRFRLEVPPPGDRHPYLLLRQGGRVEVLPVRPDGESGALAFEGRLETGDVLDFYLLEAPSPDPAALPAEGPVKGRRQRVYPRSP